MSQIAVDSILNLERIFPNSLQPSPHKNKHQLYIQKLNISQVFSQEAIRQLSKTKAKGASNPAAVNSAIPSAWSSRQTRCPASHDQLLLHFMAKTTWNHKKKSGRNLSKTPPPKKKTALSAPLNFWLETQIWHLHTLDLLRQRLDEIIEAVHNPSEGFHLKIHWLMSGWPTGKIWENWFHVHQYCVKALLSCLARNLLHFFLNLKLSANAWPLCAGYKFTPFTSCQASLVMLFTWEYQRWSWIKPATGLGLFLLTTNLIFWPLIHPLPIRSGGVECDGLKTPWRRFLPRHTWLDNSRAGGRNSIQIL